MIDPELIQLCADPRLEVEIVQQFVSEMNASDHLAIHVSQGNRTILVPMPETIEQAVKTTREWVGKASVRVGLTQYPAGLGVTDPTQIDPDLFDSCHNLRMGTELFGKVYRIVTTWYGNPRPEAFDDAISAYRTGWFEGEQVFYAVDPENVEVANPVGSERTDANEQGAEASAATADYAVNQPVADEDPNTENIRVDLSKINAQQELQD